MKDITICIIDDNQFALKLLEGYIEKTTGLVLVGVLSDAIKAKDDFLEGRINADITILDIEMPWLSGIDLAKQIASLTHIIFLTGHRKFALESYDYNAIDYLVKPVSYERFLLAIEKAKSRISKEVIVIQQLQSLPDHIFIPGNGKAAFVKILFKDIIYMVADGNYSKIFLQGDIDKTTYLTLRQLEELLPPQLFIRTHNSYMLAIPLIDRIDANTVYLANGITIPIGKTYKPDVRKRIIS